MLNSLSVLGVKNCDSCDTVLGPVTLFAGPNESGKTGMMESLRLALTGKADIGAKNALQSLIVSGNSGTATVQGEILGKLLVGVWQLVSKQAKDGTTKNSVSHNLSYNGLAQHVDAITAGLPVTSKDFWQLTGEDKWAAIEGVVGKFDLPQPADPKEIKHAIDTLMNRQSPEAYVGEPILVLTSKARGLSEWIKQQKKLRQHLAYREQKLTNSKTRLTEQQAKLEEEVANSHAAEQSLSDTTDLIDRLQPLIAQWESSPEYRLNADGSCLSDAMGSFVDRIRSDGELLHDLSESYPEIREKIDSILVDASLLDGHLADRETELKAVSLTPPCVAQIHAIISESNVAIDSRSHGSITSPMSTSQLMQGLLSTTQQKYKQSLERSESHQREIESLKEIISQEGASHDACASEESIIAKAQELATTQEQLAKAEQWQRWITSSQDRLEQIETLRTALKAAEDALGDWQRQRSAYMQSNLSAITTIANSILTDVGCKPITLAVETTGKRNTLTLTAGGTNILAMADSQQVIYGAALLHSLQMLSPSLCPVLFIKAGEISGDRLGRFLDSLVLHRTKGNVFAEHWYTPEATTATVISL